MQLEELREALAHLPAFDHTEVAVVVGLNEDYRVDRVEYRNGVVLVQPGDASARRAEAKEAVRRQIDRRHESETVLHALVNGLLEGRLKSPDWLREVQQAVVHGRVLPQPDAGWQQRRRQRMVHPPQRGATGHG